MKTLIVTLALGVIGGAAWAEELEIWGESGDWTIRINPDVGNGCLMETELGDGTLVQFGSVPNRRGGFFAAYNADWTNITDGETTTVKLDFEKKRFSGDALGVVRDGLHGAYVFFDNPNVAVEIAKNKTMTVLGGKGGVVEIDLTGTARGREAIEECMADQAN